MVSQLLIYQRVLRCANLSWFDLDAGDIFCRESLGFRSFEDDLLTDHQWQQKDQLITETGLGILQQPIQEHLAGLEQQLERRLAEVNQRIAAGENESLQLNSRNPQGRWTLQYPPAREPVNHAFYHTLRQVDISSVLHFVNRHCQFMAAFEHVLGRYVKHGADDRAITACLVAWGTNMGLGKMGEISDLPYQTLATTSENFLRLETLRTANDRISNALNRTTRHSYTQAASCESAASELSAVCRASTAAVTSGV